MRFIKRFLKALADMTVGNPAHRHSAWADPKTFGPAHYCGCCGKVDTCGHRCTTFG